MKKTDFFIKSAILFSIAAAFLGCSNLSSSADFSEESAKTTEQAAAGKSVLTLSLKENPPVSAAKFIQAASFSVASVTDWTLTCTPVTESGTDGEISLAWSSSTSAAAGDNESTLSFSSEDSTLTATYIPDGTYTLKLKGKYTDSSQNTITLTGSKSGLAIAQGKATSGSIGLSLAKESTGGLALTMNDPSEMSVLSSSSNYSSSIIFTLKSLTDSSTTITYNKDDGVKPAGIGSITISYPENSSTALIEGSIPSGIYEMSLYISDSYTAVIPAEDKVIEIADGLTTTKEFDLAISDSKTYYASNDSSASGNGLSVYSRANLATLLENLASSLPDAATVEIYVNSSAPEFDIDAINALKTKLADSGTTVSVLSSLTQTTALQVSANGLTLDSGVVLRAKANSASDAATLEVATLTGSSERPLTLVNGASIKVTGESADFPSNDGHLILYATKETDQGEADNLEYYQSVALPFLVLPTTESKTAYIELFDSSLKEKSTFTPSYAAVDSDTSGSSSFYAYYASQNNAS